MERGLRNVFANFAWLSFSRGTSALFSLAYLAIATRTLGVTDFGRFALILSAAQAITVFVGFQTWQIVVQYGVRHLLANDEGALTRLVRGCCVLDLASAGAGAVISAAMLWLAADTFGLDGDLMRDAILFNLALLLSIRSTPLGILRLHDRYALGATAESVMPTMRMIGALLALLALPTIQGFLLAWAIAEIATAVAFWLFAARTGELKRMWHMPASLADLREENPELVRFSLTTNAGSTIGLAGKQLSVLLVGAYVGPAAAGGFRIAYQLAQALTKLSQMLSRAAFPELVRARASAAAVQTGKILRRLTIISSVTALVVVGVGFVGGRPLLALVGGKAYVDAYPLLLWLGAAGCVDLAATTFEPALIAAGRAGQAFILRLIATIALLLFMLLLLPLIGAEGAAIGSFAGSLTAALLLGLAVVWRDKPT